MDSPVREVGIRTHDDEVRAAVMEPAQGVLTHAVQLREAKIFPHFSRLFAGDGPKLSGAGQLGSQPLRHIG